MSTQEHSPKGGSCSIKSQMEDRYAGRAVLFDCLLLLVCLVSIYSLTYSGAFQVDDEHLLAARAQSHALRGTLDFPQVYGNERLRSLSLVDQAQATPVEAIEPLQAWIGSLLYQTALLFGWGGSQTFFLSNLYTTAFTAVVVYLIVWLLAYPRKIAFACAWAYGAGSMAWPYAKRLFRDPLAAFFVAVAFLGWILLVQRASRQRLLGVFLLLTGILAAVLSKSNVFVLLPALALSGLVSLWRQRGQPRVKKALVLSLLLMGFVIVGLLVLAQPTGPLARFAPGYYLELIQRYLSNLRWSTLIAAIGPFFSPAKSIFLFSPILMLGVWGLIVERDQLGGFALPAVITVLCLAVAQALHLGPLWAGSLFWGLRFMLPALPLLAVAAAPTFVRILESADRLPRILLAVLAGFSLLVQWVGTSVAWYVPFLGWLERGLDPYKLDAVWKLDFLVIPYHVLALFDFSTWDVAWLRTAGVDPWALLIPFTALVAMAGGLLLWRSGRKAGWRKWGLLRLGVFVGILILILPMGIGLPILDRDPAAGGDRQEIRTCLTWVQSQLAQGDLVVVEAYGTPLWHAMMNQWHAPTLWLSLPHAYVASSGAALEGEARIHEDTLAIHEARVVAWDRIVYIAQDAAGEYESEPVWRWLDQHALDEGGARCDGNSVAQVWFFR